jgi:hypothetical protein
MALTCTCNGFITIIILILISDIHSSSNIFY